MNLPRERSIAFKRLPLQEFDYGHKIGIGVEGTMNGLRFRHACLVRTKDWKSMSTAQREEIWRLVESMVRILAKKA